MARWVVVRHDDNDPEGELEVVAIRDTPAEARQVANEMRNTLPSGSSVYFEVRPAYGAKETIPEPDSNGVDSARHQPTQISNCADVKLAVAKRPWRPGERAYLIKKAIEFNCPDDTIPNNWTIEFRKDS